MKLPRDLGGEDLAKRLGKLGYKVTRQTGSHMRLTQCREQKMHHLTIPRHQVLKVGTLSRILKDVARRLGLTVEELVVRLWGADDG